MAVRMNPKPKTYFGSPKCHKNAQIFTQYFHEFLSDQSILTQKALVQGRKMNLTR